MNKGLTRRRVLKATSGTWVVVTLPELSTVPADETIDENVISSWPMFAHDTANTGHVPEATVPKTGIREQWQFETGGKVISSPAVVDGTVFIGLIKDNRYSILALAASHGDELWDFSTGDSVDSSPAVVNGTVFIGSQNENLYAIDAASGEEEWRFQVGEVIRSSPAVVNGTVFIGSTDTNLYAIDATSGEEQWRFETGNAVSSSPAVADGTIYIGSTDNNVYALTAPRPTTTEESTPTSEHTRTGEPTPTSEPTRTENLSPTETPSETETEVGPQTDTPQYGALGIVGLTIGFVIGNSESERFKHNTLTIVTAMFGGSGLIGVIQWLQSEGDNTTALLIAAGALGMFSGMLVGIYFRKRGFSLTPRNDNNP